MNPCVSFLSTDALAFTGAGAVSCSVHGHQDPPRTRRRALLRVAGLALAGAVVPLRARAARAWTDAELCGSCGGCGQQPCSLCSGSGIFTVDDSVVTQSLECPNCQGAGRVRCLRCIGLGLSDTRGVLRNGARNGSLRMMQNGNYEILDCEAYPACGLYGLGKKS